MIIKTCIGCEKEVNSKTMHPCCNCSRQNEVQNKIDYYEQRKTSEERLKELTTGVVPLLSLLRTGIAYHSEKIGEVESKGLINKIDVFLKDYEALQEKAIEYLLYHVEDFGVAKYTRTGELNCVGKLGYGCVNMAVAMNIIKIMQGEEVINVSSSYKKRV